jgi:Flp pilus assembly protein TadD
VKHRAKARAGRGAELSPEESRCHGILGYCHALLGEFDAGEREAALSISLNPCDADALFGLAIVLVWRGDSAEALTRIEQAKELNPLWPAHYDILHSEALFLLGRYAESIHLHLRLPRLSARHEMRLAAAYALAGEADLARQHAAAARARQPSWDFVEKARHAHSLGNVRDVQRLVEGTELALRLLDEP